ncbi:MAG TPA: YggT family protein [Candidatus Eremiobacteraceae bacterium]
MYERAVCTIFDVARFILTAEGIAIVARIIASWVPEVPPALTTLLRRLTDGVLLPFQSVIPIIGGFDLSPLAALLVLQAIVHYVPLCPTV